MFSLFYLTFISPGRYHWDTISLVPGSLGQDGSKWRVAPLGVGPAQPKLLRSVMKSYFWWDYEQPELFWCQTDERAHAAESGTVIRFSVALNNPHYHNKPKVFLHNMNPRTTPTGSDVLSTRVSENHLWTVRLEFEHCWKDLLII